MEKIVYLLGAGFSAPLGLPIMSTFIAKAKDLYFRDPKAHDHFKHVLEQIERFSVIKNYFSCDLFNVEEILSLIEMRCQLEGRAIDDEFYEFVADVIRFHTPPPEPYRQHRLPGNWWDFIFGNSTSDRNYGFFAANLLNLNIRDEGAKSSGSDLTRFKISQNPSPSAAYSVVTLNYDLVLERHCDYLNKGYEPDPPINFGDPSSGSGLWESGALMMKLHGTVRDSQIVLPTWSKGINNKILPSWQFAYSALVEANYWRIIGFSLPESDSYVKYLLKAAVSKAKHLKAIDVICRDTNGSVRSRFDDFITFPDYSFVNASVEGYLEALVESQRENKETYRRTENAMRFQALEASHAAWMRKAHKA